MTPSEVGTRTEAHVIAALVEAGYEVLVPFGGHLRYDLVFEDQAGRFWRVQCKTGSLRGDVIAFLPYSRTNQVMKDYRGEVDFFGVYCHPRREVYLIPIDALPPRSARLRLTPTKNGQAKGIRWARDFLLWSAREHDGAQLSLAGDGDGDVIG
jgi:hypothetical protein